MNNLAAPPTPDLVPVPGPEDVEHLAAIRLLLGPGAGWKPVFQPADRLHVSLAKSIHRELAKLLLCFEVREGRLFYGPAAGISLMELVILVAWQAPLVALLTSPKRGRHG